MRPPEECPFMLNGDCVYLYLYLDGRCYECPNYGAIGDVIGRE